MIIKKANFNDFNEIMAIYAHAREFMKDSGNPTQWNDSYPSEELVRSDIEGGYSYVAVDGEEIVAAFFFKEGVDESYFHIEGGEWRNSEPYAVIHRVAVKYNGRGIVKAIYDYCYGICPNIRIDTHRDNLPMQRSLAKCGFVYCGVIRIYNGEERIAFQKCEG